jgi:hypothetical protein
MLLFLLAQEFANCHWLELAHYYHRFGYLLPVQPVPWKRRWLLGSAVDHANSNQELACWLELVRQED